MSGEVPISNSEINLSLQRLFAERVEELAPIAVRRKIPIATLVDVVRRNVRGVSEDELVALGAQYLASPDRVGDDIVMTEGESFHEIGNHNIHIEWGHATDSQHHTDSIFDDYPFDEYRVMFRKKYFVENSSSPLYAHTAHLSDIKGDPVGISLEEFIRTHHLEDLQELHAQLLTENQAPNKGVFTVQRFNEVMALLYRLSDSTIDTERVISA